MSIKSFLRTLRLKIGKQILDKKTPLASIIFPPKSILFLRHDGKIGDYVVSSFIFREIKKQAPNTKIGVVCSKKECLSFLNKILILINFILLKQKILEIIFAAVNNFQKNSMMY